MNLRFWQKPDDDDDEEEPVSIPNLPTATERRAARLANAPAPVRQDDLPPDPGERFYASFIGFISVVAPLLVSALIGVSTGYFLADFHLAADVPTAIGMSGGMLVAGVDLAIVMQKKRASKYGEDEEAAWLLAAAILFGVIDIVTMYIYLQVNLTHAANAEATLENIPLAGILIGIGNGSLFVLIRAAVYHLALYSAAWGLGTIKPTPERMVKWQMQRHIQLQTEVVLGEIRQRGTVTIAEASATALAAPTKQRDLLAVIQQMQQQLTEMQVKQRATTGQYRTLEPESEAAPDGDTSFR